MPKPEQQQTLPASTLTGSLARFLTARSINRRFLISCCILIPFFLGVLGAGLDDNHQTSLIRATQEALRLHTVTLISEAEISDLAASRSKLVMPEYLIDPDFNTPGSGIFGFIGDEQGNLLWASQSAVISGFYYSHLPLSVFKPGAKVFATDDEDFFLSSFDTLFEGRPNDVSLRFVTVKSKNRFRQEMHTYRQSLLVALSLIGIGLAITLLLIVRWGLRPLDRLANDITRLENGDIEYLDNHYPAELSTLTANLNLLIDTEKKQRERYRNTLSDLAHSLKTPLAIMQGLLGDQLQRNNVQKDIDEQVTRMNQIIQYQLQRAVAASPTVTHRKTETNRVIERVVSALKKVYCDKSMSVLLELEDHCQVAMDERDLSEILGNLLDNAFKYGESTISVSSKIVAKQWQLMIKDDGKGIQNKHKTAILERGARADTAVAGQGIGLAVVIDIVSSYGGKLTVTDSEPKGACFTLSIPAR
ncbi:MAG: hypothetical protein CSA52_01700 [Gammaproteobacteria bacterium]|nr:MAG: hypothetical protein CSB48_03005 [Pseudomonadota bacterium]PIE38626.1 MAG: hypothetical protein CSA52_01700 [Gammaproteobacteria bacterium]